MNMSSNHGHLDFTALCLYRQKNIKGRGKVEVILQHGIFYSGNIFIKMEATSNISIHISLY